jgi:hypothetical protein
MKDRKQKTAKGKRFICIGNNLQMEVDNKLQRIKSLHKEPKWVQEALKDQQICYKLCYRSLQFLDHHYWLYYDRLFRLRGEYSFDRKRVSFLSDDQLDSNDWTRIKKVQSMVDPWAKPKDK